MNIFAADHEEYDGARAAALPQLSVRSLARIIHGRVGEARMSFVHGALREPVQNSVPCFPGFDSVRNPPFPLRFAPRTLQFMNNPG